LQFQLRLGYLEGEFSTFGIPIAYPEEVTVVLMGEETGVGWVGREGNSHGKSKSNGKSNSNSNSKSNSNSRFPSGMERKKQKQRQMQVSPLRGYAAPVEMTHLWRDRFADSGPAAPKTDTR
jgi:hypothetical protein